MSLFQLKLFIPGLLFFNLLIFASQQPQISAPKDLEQIIEWGLKANPVFKEEVLKSRLAKADWEIVKSKTLLPKFEISASAGPAPNWDSQDENFDWTSYTYAAYTRGKFVQPLNFWNLSKAKKAAFFKWKSDEDGLGRKETKLKIQITSMYYDCLLARELLAITREGDNKLVKALNKLEERLDNDEEDVEQADIFEFQTRLYELKKGLAKAEKSVSLSIALLKFSLGLKEVDSLRLPDTLLLAVELKINTLPFYQKLAFKKHPALKQLANGIAASRYKLSYEKGLAWPQLFIGGEFKIIYAPEVENQNGPSFLNRKRGALGIGFRQDLSFHNRNARIKKEKLKLKVLVQKSNYAVSGIELKIKASYETYLEAKKNLENATVSERASSSWLKSESLKYDLDPSNAKNMLTAYIQDLKMKKEYYMAIVNFNNANYKLKFETHEIN